MGRPAHRPHELRLRNRQGKAVCSYQGREYRFGRWDLKLDAPTPEAVSAFQRQIGLWTLNPLASTVTDPSPTLLSLWSDWLESPQRPKVNEHVQLMATTHLFGTPTAPGPHLNTPLDSFTSADLLAWQTRLCEMRDDKGKARYGRATVAKLVGLVRRCLDWGVMVGRVSADQYAAIERVKPPPRGQVREPVRRGSVSWDTVEVTARHMRSAMGDLLRCLWWTGARPGELCAITAGMVRRGGVIRSRLKAEVSIDLDGFGVWAADLGDGHKTAHHGKERVLFFGPNAQEIVAPYLDAAKSGTCPLFPNGHGKHYTGPRLYTATATAAKRAGVSLAPYLIRHSFAVRVVEAFSSEIPGSGYLAAQSALGHSLRGVTAGYTGQDWITAAKVAQRCG